ncbi:hypothetical protein [Magnetofaba australis]|uniref:Uncharacterized protein n=1 Tax=Magnetofaba australis IT-1 TaxID=1434232 RepID=A0A1Y2K5Y4_9PROT|nr:hypothetical protein [Magnetofaba australis]OSM02524.1 hypothetical protein MAIT1_02680 [Magnetofaba australis IT-1]
MSKTLSKSPLRPLGRALMLAAALGMGSLSLADKAEAFWGWDGPFNGWNGPFSGWDTPWGGGPWGGGPWGGGPWGGGPGWGGYPGWGGGYPYGGYGYPYGGYGAPYGGYAYPGYAYPGYAAPGAAAAPQAGYSAADIETLKTSLGIQSHQESAWNDLVSAVNQVPDGESILANPAVTSAYAVLMEVLNPQQQQMAEAFKQSLIY